MAPTIYATSFFDDLDEFLLELAEHDKEITAGVAATGEAAAYAEVWEWGNMRQSKEGPRTVLGVNPDGEDVWLSFQAPAGYISIHENQYWDILKQELKKVKFKSKTAQGITKELQSASVRAMKRIIPIISDSAPIGIADTSPTLNKSFRVVMPGDPSLDNTDDRKVLTFGMEE
jgi:hypothetical protein